MLKSLVIIVILISFILFIPSQSNLYTDVHQSVVAILANNSKNITISQGTGFFIDKNGDVITNLHVINGSSDICVITADKHTYSVKNVLAKNISSDLVCLSVNISSQLVHPIELNIAQPEIGDPVFVVGYPEGPGKLEQSMTFGIVSSVQTLPEYGDVIKIDAAISPGTSGSPLVNENGDTIGVATFGYIKGQNQNFAVSGNQVLRLIQDISLQGGEPIFKWTLTPEERLYATKIDLYRKGLNKDINSIRITNKSKNIINNSIINNIGISVTNNSSNSIVNSDISNTSISVSEDSINSISDTSIGSSNGKYNINCRSINLSRVHVRAYSLDGKTSMIGNASFQVTNHSIIVVNGISNRSDVL